jgi:hypothetical protein
MPRKSLKQRQTGNQQKGRRPVADTNKNRVRDIVNGLFGNEKPDDLMTELMQVLTETETKPSAGNYYTFFYNPKTPGITFDEYPLVAVTDIFSWGFRGINFHWERVRQYSWDEINGSLYKVRPEELKDMRTIPYAKIRINN